MKICIIANNAYGALTGEESGHIGGVERQTALLSEWLTTNGHEVIVITWDEGGAPVEYINGLKIIKLCKITEGLPVLRFFTPRWTSLTAALKAADAEMYYHNCAEYVTGQVAMWCKFNHKPFIYTVASDADCEINLPNLASKREEYLFKYGLTHTDLVITQTQKQKKLLHQNYSIDAQVINMPTMPPQPKENFDRKNLFNKQKVIWVGRLHKVKRIEWLIDIAENSPDISFEVIGPEGDLSEYMANNLLRLTKTSNISYLGKISRAEMPSIYQNASLICCTSIYEGFPNTYLEAWSYGLPIVTTIDPDDIIKTKHLGYHLIDKNDYALHLNLLLNNKNLWEKTSLNCYEYYLHNHEQNSVMKQFESAFLSVGVLRIGKHFDQKSSEWSEYYKNNATSIAHLDLQQRLIYCQKMLLCISSNKQTRELLDLGCGPGDSFETIKSTGEWKISGIDISREMIKIAQKQHPETNLNIANGTELPFIDDTFQTVISLGVLEYIDEYRSTISEVKRVLEPHGHFIVSIPNKQSIFRLLRKIENLFVKPFKKIPFLNKKKKNIPSILHQQWSQKAFCDELVYKGFIVEKIEYCTYAFLSPKLEDSRLNIELSKWLHKKLAKNQKIKTFLANTIIIHARVNEK